MEDRNIKNDLKNRKTPNFLFIHGVGLLPLILSTINLKLSGIVLLNTESALIYFIVEFIFFVIVSAIWFYLGYVSKRFNIRGFFSLWLINFPLIIFALFSIAQVFTSPNTPHLIKQVASHGNLYTAFVSFASVTPFIHISKVFGNYYILMQLAPVIALIYLWAIFYLGYLYKK